jgi:hypothetical protein
MANDATWFIANRGLTRGRIDVLSLIETIVPSSQIEEMFGPKVSENGYRYDRKVPPNIAKCILELYTRVTRKQKETNGQINKTFARAMISLLKGNHLDWPYIEINIIWR